MNIFERNAKKLTRRDFLKTALGSGIAITGLAGISSNKNVSALPQGDGDLSMARHGDSHNDHGNPGTVGQVDHDANGFDPLSLLYEWDYGEVSQLPNGQTLREYNIAAVDKEIEIAPGLFFPAWTYNGRVPDRV